MESFIPFKTDIDISNGKFLISEPMLQDISFQKSVIFICHHDEDESIGYVINKGCKQGLGNVVNDLNNIFFPLYIGGPVAQDSLHFIHTMPQLLGGDVVDKEIYWGGDLETAIEQMKVGKITAANCKFFLGYSGWSKGQLQSELDLNAWLVANASTPLLFEDREELIWKLTIEGLGAKYKPLLHVPLHAEFN